MSLPTNQTQINVSQSFFVASGSNVPPPVYNYATTIQTTSTITGESLLASGSQIDFLSTGVTSYAYGVDPGYGLLATTGNYPALAVGANSGSVSIYYLNSANTILGSPPTTTIASGGQIDFTSSSGNCGFVNIPLGLSSINVPNTNVASNSVILTSVIDINPINVYPNFACVYPENIIPGTGFNLTTNTLYPFNVSTFWFMPNNS
jgi:hypothetical protein